MIALDISKLLDECDFIPKEYEGVKQIYEFVWNTRMKLLKESFENAKKTYKGEEKEELVLFAKEQEQAGNHHDLYIFGHRHIELDLMLSRDSRMMILGDCWRMFTYVQINDNFDVMMMNYE